MQKKTPRDIIGAENVIKLKRAGFVIVPRSELTKIRALIKLMLDSLPTKALRKPHRR